MVLPDYLIRVLKKLTCHCVCRNRQYVDAHRHACDFLSTRPEGALNSCVRDMFGNWTVLAHAIGASPASSRGHDERPLLGVPKLNEPPLSDTYLWCRQVIPFRGMRWGQFGSHEMRCQTNDVKMV
jgi:hypothetical protein